MGGCVASALSVKNSFSVVSHEDIRVLRESENQSVAITPPGTGESSIYRYINTKDITLEQMFERYYGGKHISIANWMKEMCVKFATRKGLGVRPLERIENTTITDAQGRSKPWAYFHYGPTKYYSYGEFWEMITSFGVGLADITRLRPGAHVAIYEDTRLEWMVSCYGLWTQSLIGVTIYANLGEDALTYAIEEAELDVVILNGKSVSTFINAHKKTLSQNMPILITIDDIPAGSHVADRCVIHPWTVVLEHGSAIKKERQGIDVTALPKSPNDTALIMYTSGTSGDPKGVILSHGNLYAGVQGFDCKLSRYLEGHELSYVAYLPLAHIFEFAAENMFLLRGAIVGFGTPRTLTSLAARPHGDLEEFKPIILCGVPRVFDAIKKAVETKLPDGFKRKIFTRAYNDRLEGYKAGMDWQGWNKSAFKTTRALVGGNIIAFLSGGAPLSAKTQEFLTVIFGASIIQGYGLTETCANVTIQDYWDMSPDTIGPLLCSCEVKLVDFDEWKHTDPEPRGEIWVRGPVVSQGYYKQPEKTKEAFLPDGWFRTGDIGLMSRDGTLRIIGRVKSIVKNAFGEYIALEALEAIYVLNDLCVPNGVCVLVDGHKSYIIALVCTDESKAMKFAKLNNITGKWPEVLEKEEFHEKAALSLAKTAMANNRKPFECVKFVRVLADEWTPENGILTAAQKIKRREVDRQYAKVIAELFKSEA